MPALVFDSGCLVAPLRSSPTTVTRVPQRDFLSWRCVSLQARGCRLSRRGPAVGRRSEQGRESVR